MKANRFILATVALLVSAHFISADAAEPAFHITRIDVEGARWVSKDIIREESRLKLGQFYTEKELVLALRRITRLSFILSADFSLAKGETYGTYALVIHVSEENPLLFQYEKSWIDMTRRENVKGISYDSGLPPSSDAGSSTQSLEVGGRMNIGAYGIGYAIVSRESPSVEAIDAPFAGLNVGFSHYNLMGKHVFLNVNLQFTGERVGIQYDRPTYSRVSVKAHRPISPSLTVSVPVKKNQWVSFDINYAKQMQEYDFPEVDVPIQDQVTDKRLQMDLSWYYDTTDDLLIPLRGMRMESGVEYVHQKSEFHGGLYGASDWGVMPPPGERLNIYGITQNMAEGTMIYVKIDKYWSPTNRLAVDVQAHGSHRLHEAGGNIKDMHYRELGLAIGVSWDMWGRSLTERHGDLRLEVRGRQFNQNIVSFKSDERVLEAGILFRNRWGVIRLSYCYLYNSLGASNGETSDVTNRQFS